jgi:beta-phosphoglucomutase-like phosphatase (HAD superfamily)
VVPIAVASSSTRRLVHGVLEGLGVLARFDVALSGDDVARPKPAPDLFLEAARRIGARAEDCVVLEDSLAGATAGHAAGMRVIAVPDGASAASPRRGPHQGQQTPGIDRVATIVVRDLHEARAHLRLEAPSR